MIKAGFARLDITPPLGSPIAGYFYDRYADGVLDPLEVNAIAIGNGTDTIILITADILGISEYYSEPVCKKIAEKLSIPREHIMLTALHQHTSVGLFVGNPIVEDRVYMDMLFRKMEDVATLAVADMSEATIGYAEGECAEPISFVRRYFMKDGTVATNPGRQNPEIDRPASDADNTTRLLRFTRKGATDIALVGFSTHPDVIGGDKLTADWPGFVRRFVERDLGVKCIFFNGTQGDTNHIDVNVPQAEDTYGQARDMGRTVADVVVGLWDKTTPVAGDSVTGSMTTVYTRTRTDGEERYDEMKAFYDKYQSGELGYEPHITVLTTAKRIINIRTAKIYIPVNITVMGVGEVAFVGFGGEPFTQYSRNAAAAAGGKRVITMCCANGYGGYLPTEAAFREGGYEASSSMFSPNLETLVKDATAELLDKLPKA